jgi:hypothetical protein
MEGKYGIVKQSDYFTFRTIKDMEVSTMKQEVVTFSQSLTHPVSVSFTCEHCGASNSFIQEIVGEGRISGGKRGADGNYTMSPKDSLKIMELARKDLEYKVKKAEKKIAKGNFSWLKANECVKCNKYQSWNNRRIWKDFLMVFFGAPFIVLLVVGFPITLIYKNTSDYPLWVDILLISLILILMIGATINLAMSLSKTNHKNRNKPNVIMPPI